MRIEQLSYFVEAANWRSIHKASDKLHISHQSLNASLTSLEQELGVALLIRDSRGVSLTPAGELALAYARDVLKRTQSFTAKLASLSAESTPITPSGQLHCLMGPNIALYVLPQLINRFTAQFPAVALSLTELESNLIIAQLMAGQEGLSFISTYKNAAPDFAAYPHLYYNPLYTERNYAVVSTAHPLARYKAISLKTLLKYPLSLYQAADNSSSTLLDYLNAAGSPKIHLLSNNLTICKEAILSGQTVGIIPKQAVKRELIFPAQAPVVYLTLKDMAPVVIAFLVSHTYYNANRQLIDPFLALFQSIW